MMRAQWTGSLSGLWSLVIQVKSHGPGCPQVKPTYLLHDVHFFKNLIFVFNFCKISESLAPAHALFCWPCARPPYYFATIRAVWCRVVLYTGRRSWPTTTVVQCRGGGCTAATCTHSRSLLRLAWSSPNPSLPSWAKW